MSVDALVIGAGHNGLTAALRLRSAGLSVVVCERRDRPGGLAARHEFHPGFHAPGILHDTSTWRSWLTRELQLETRGWTTRPASPVCIPLDDRRHLLLTREADDPRLQLDACPAGTVEAYRRWRGFVSEVTPPLQRLLDRPAPRLDLHSVGDLWGLARDGWALRRLGRKTMIELLRVLPMPAADWLRESFAHEPLLEGLAAPGVLGTWLGPHSSGSNANLLAYEALAGDENPAGPGALIDALCSSCREANVELRLGAAVEGIVIESGAVRAVRLSGGEQIACRFVLASCDPKSALLGLLPPAVLPMTVRDQVTNWRTRGTLAKVHLALAAPLELGGAACAAARIGGGSIDALERAFDAVKYRRRSSEPYLDLRQPSLHEPGLAPEGQHVASLLVGFAPHDVAGGWDEAERSGLYESVVRRLELHAPRVREQILGSEVLAPPDLERLYGCSGGHLHHGEHALDQMLFVRPGHLLAHYRTPIEGLFLGGSGCHPGGGITGVPGWLSAGAVLSERGSGVASPTR